MPDLHPAVCPYRIQVNLGNTQVLAKEVTLWPKGITFEAYATIFQDGQLTHSMLYTVLVTALFTAIGMVITICAAYPLSRRRLKGATSSP